MARQWDDLAVGLRWNAAHAVNAASMMLLVEVKSGAAAER
jgi:hypothetical protein